MALQLEGEPGTHLYLPDVGGRHAASGRSGNLPICASIAPADTEGFMASLPRGSWRGQSERLPDGFRLTQVRHGCARTVTCEVWSHTDGAELRLRFDDGTMPVETVVSSGGQMRDLLAAWTSVLVASGWS